MTTFRPAPMTRSESLTSPDVCQCCGREFVKTVKVTDGAATFWFGKGCAAKACGLGVAEFGRAQKRAQDAHAAEERAKRAAEHDAWLARWTAFLDARCPDLRGDMPGQIAALGGYDAATTAFGA